MQTVVVTRAMFPEVITRLAEHFIVEVNQDDGEWSSADLAQRLSDADGALTTISGRIDESVLTNCPKPPASAQENCS